VILAGWSQGAAMAVAAAADLPASTHGQLAGVVTLGLPESAVLGWDWKASLAVIARREPDQPHFSVTPLLPKVTPKPIWMIHGNDDEYSTPAVARTLFQTASEPKHLDEIAGADHRFYGHRDEFYRSLRRGLEWIVAQ
jgi:pimeloyl-ACP methyl ester carboxylesterase